jgi:hypothetical protein
MQSISGDDEYIFGLHTCGLPHGRYARIAMTAMFGASVTGRGWLLFHSCDFGVRLLSHMQYASQATTPCLFWCRVLHLTWVGTVLGELIPGTTRIPIILSRWDWHTVPHPRGPSTSERRVPDNGGGGDELLWGFGGSPFYFDLTRAAADVMSRGWPAEVSAGCEVAGCGTWCARGTIITYI